MSDLGTTTRLSIIGVHMVMGPSLTVTDRIIMPRLLAAVRIIYRRHPIIRLITSCRDRRRRLRPIRLPRGTRPIMAVVAVVVVDTITRHLR